MFTRYESYSSHIMTKVDVTCSNVHIEESWTMSKHAFHAFLTDLRNMYPDNPVLNGRSVNDMAREWAVHNFLYSWGLMRERTGSVDLDYPRKWYKKVAYDVIGTLVWSLIK